eukprot:365346-Chlamydomonas_euryale.AAC.5
MTVAASRPVFWPSRWARVAASAAAAAAPVDAAAVVAAVAVLAGAAAETAGTSGVCAYAQAKATRGLTATEDPKSTQRARYAASAATLSISAPCVSSDAPCLLSSPLESDWLRHHASNSSMLTPPSPSVFTSRNAAPASDSP